MEPTRFRSLRTAFDDSVAAQGYQVAKFTSAAALNIGDNVYLSATGGTVDKSVTQSNYLNYAGVVVGGRSTYNKLIEVTTTTSLTVAACSAAAQDVLVAIHGIVYMVAGAAITFPNRLTPDTGTAGRVIAWSATTLIIGSAIEAAAANGSWFRALLNPR